MTENKLYEAKKDNLMRMLERSGADHVPTMLASSCAQIAWAGKKVADVIGDPQEYAKAMTDVLKVMWADANTFSGTLFTPAIDTYIYPVQNKFGPDGITPEHLQLPMMKDDEYDLLIRDPPSLITEVLLPRKYPILFEDREYAKEALRKIAWDKAYSMAILFSAVEKMLEEEYGVVNMVTFAGVFSNPCDTIFDYYRGFSGTLTDLRRHTAEFKAACETLWHTQNLPALQRTPAKFPYACHMTHIAPYMSPKQFNEIYWPYEKQWIDHASEHGTKVWIMMEGKWQKVWENFKDVARDTCILHVDDDDIVDAKKDIGDCQILEGGLRTGSVRMDDFATIRKELIRVLDACVPGEGFLFCTDKAWIAPGDVNQNLIDAYNFVHEYAIK
ncbi:MAG: hypothetical protein J5822_00620 [Eubacteriaceae bacterium]|nr:hypothetical protein [Eubacteriaceae bacterium]